MQGFELFSQTFNFGVFKCSLYLSSLFKFCFYIQCLTVFIYHKELNKVHPQKYGRLLQTLDALIDQVECFDSYNYMFVELLILCDTVYGFRHLLIT